MSSDDIWFPVGVAMGVIIGIVIMAIVIDTTISKEQIEIAHNLCGERQIDWMSPMTVKCKDGARYENYNEVTETP